MRLQPRTRPCCVHRALLGEEPDLASEAPILRTVAQPDGLTDLVDAAAYIPVEERILAARSALGLSVTVIAGRHITHRGGSRVVRNARPGVFALSRSSHLR
jgi:hypothetical protein